MRKIIYFICCLLILLACTGEKTIETVPEYSISIKKKVTDVFLGRPSEIAYMDSFLLISDNMNETLLDIYDLKGDSMFSRVLNVGQGPDELLSPITVEVSEEEHELYILQRQNSQMNTYSFYDLMQGKFQPQKSVNLQDADRAIAVCNGFLASGFYEDGTFHLFDTNGKKLASIDIYPSYIQELKDIYEKYKLGQGYFAYNHNSHVLVFAFYFTGDVFFYSMEGNQLFQQNYFSFGNGKIKRKIESLKSNINIEGDDIVYSYGAYNAGNYFYILYSGKTLKEEQSSKKGDYILKFDLEGNFICKYKHDFPVIDMCFANNGDFYAISQSENLEYNIITFSLD